MPRDKSSMSGTAFVTKGAARLHQAIVDKHPHFAEQLKGLGVSPQQVAIAALAARFQAVRNSLPPSKPATNSRKKP